MTEHDEGKAFGHVQRGCQVRTIVLIMVPSGIVLRLARHFVGGISPRRKQLEHHAQGIIQEIRVLIRDVLHHELHEACRIEPVKDWTDNRKKKF